MTDPKARVVEILDDAYKGIEEAPNPKEVADRLDEAGLLAEPWMSVKTPPKEPGYYLVYRPEFGCTVKWIDHDTWPDKFIIGSGSADAITHWQPLPEAPK